MVRIEVNYRGELHCQTVHVPSGTPLETDAPVDNRGRGASFSPTDLAATALATCILTTMAIAADGEGIRLEGASATVDKEMTLSGPRRIARLTVHVRLPIPRSADPKGVLERAGRNCPVQLSLHPNVERLVEYHWRPE